MYGIIKVFGYRRVTGKELLLMYTVVHTYEHAFEFSKNVIVLTKFNACLDHQQD
jgi:hypothetical protein